jgi:hypothetical protein
MSSFCARVVKPAHLMRWGRRLNLICAWLPFAIRRRPDRQSRRRCRHRDVEKLGLHQPPSLRLGRCRYCEVDEESGRREARVEW